MTRARRDLRVRRHRDKIDYKPMTVDVVFCAHNRQHFTEFAFRCLLENTSWDRVRALHVYDDASEDGTKDMLHDMLDFVELPCEKHFHDVEFGSPVGVMNDYVGSADSERFAKIDNDIVVPAGWLDALIDTMDAHPHVDILGMESGRMGIPASDFDGVYGVEHARWIGGVGLLRTSVLGTRPQMTPNGRFGWTEWQREYRPNIAWIIPDLALSDLSRIPFDPWQSLSESYKEAEWERDWPKYHERWSQFYWAWWAPEHAKEHLE